jgi:V/A-type H+/Na+-transporting ATPase subunit C
MGKIDKTEYLFLTTRVRSLENNMINRERMEMILESGNTEEATRILQDSGYGEISSISMDRLEQSLAAERSRTFLEIASFIPDPRILDVFRIKYDYHNVKVLLKSMVQGIDGTDLLMDSGKIPFLMIQKAILQNELTSIPTKLKQAVVEAREVLSATKDPQLADTLLDRYYYEDMFDIASKAKSPFLVSYVRISIDAANLRSLVRTSRMGKGLDFLRSKLISGGNISIERILDVSAGGASLDDFYSTSLLKDAAAAGSQALQHGELTLFEKLCDDAVSQYLSTARYVPFGEQAVISYLASKETEFTAVRIIMSGLMAGLEKEIIKERLREIYV